MNLNKAFILGNVTRDPEVRALPSGQQVTNFSIATNRFYTSGAGEKKQEVEFHNIVCFGKLADISSRYLTKGSLVELYGRIAVNTYIDLKGEAKASITFHVNNIKLHRPASSSNSRRSIHL